MDDFPYAITEIYSSTDRTDRGLRDLVVEIVSEHIHALLKKQDFQAVLEETLGFAADVTRFIAQEVKKFRCYRCPSCRNIWEAAISPGDSYYCLRYGVHRSDWEKRVVTNPVIQS